MSDELCTAIAKTQFSCLAMSDLFMSISFILSHPLYFSYFIFFSPYLIRLICFLYPLFITTVLLSMAFLTSTDFSVRTAFSDRLGWSNKEYDEVDRCHQTHAEALLYEVFFGSTVIELEDSLVPVRDEPSKPSPDDDLSGGDGEAEEKTVLDPKLEKNASRSSNFLKILDGFERMSSDVEEKKKVKPTQCVKSDKVVGKGKPSKDGSEAKASDRPATIQKANPAEFCSPSVDSSRTMDYSSLGTYGSMRREKEWKRTLACKLFEERHNVGGGEGMDSLWEAYEVNSDKQKQKQEKSSKAKTKNEAEKTRKYKGGIKYDEDDEEEEIGGAGGGQLCCLQAALKLSTGKMNFGMGKPNLVKISKAIKGLGWLHHASKHSKKVHNI